MCFFNWITDTYIEWKYKEAENVPQNCTTVLEKMFCVLLGVADHFTIKNEQVYLFLNTKKKDLKVDY